MPTLQYSKGCGDSLMLIERAIRLTADLVVDEVQFSKQDPRLLEEVGDLSVYLTYLKSAISKEKRRNNPYVKYLRA